MFFNTIITDTEFETVKKIIVKAYKFGDKDQEIEVGQCEAYKFAYLFSDDHFVDGADSISQSVFEIAEYVGFSDNGIEGLSEVPHNDIIIIDKIEMESNTYKSGHLILNHLREIFSEAIIIAKPHPFKCENLKAKEIKKGKERLRRYWKLAGFEQINKSDYFYINPDLKKNDIFGHLYKNEVEEVELETV